MFFTLSSWQLGLLIFGVVGGAYYVDGIKTPDQLTFPESTTLYYSDGKTVLAKLGEVTRYNLTFDQMNDAVKQFGLQPWNNVLQVRCFKNAIEYGTAVLAFSWCGTLELLHVTSGNQPLQCCMSKFVESTM